MEQQIASLTSVLSPAEMRSAVCFCSHVKQLNGRTCTCGCIRTYWLYARDHGACCCAGHCIVLRCALVEVRRSSGGVFAAHGTFKGAAVQRSGCSAGLLSRNIQSEGAARRQVQARDNMEDPRRWDRMWTPLAPWSLAPRRRDRGQGTGDKVQGASGSEEPDERDVQVVVPVGKRLRLQHRPVCVLLAGRLLLGGGDAGRIRARSRGGQKVSNDKRGCRQSRARGSGFRVQWAGRSSTAGVESEPSGVLLASW